jgi:hypothetical protein
MMAKEPKSKSSQFDPTELWAAYSNAVDVWMKLSKATQEAASDAFKMYMQGFEKAMSTSNSDEMKKYNDIWQNAAKQFEQFNPYGWSVKAWDDMWKESGFASFKAFSDYWQHVWQNFAKDAAARSKEAMDQLSKKNTKS